MNAEPDKPDLSVVILTYKRQDELLRTLHSLLPQERVEVLVVNNHPDDTAEILSRQFPGVKYIDTGGNIGCEARNLGVAAASADIVVTIDNDVNVRDREFPSAVLDFFRRHPLAGCISFKVLTPDGKLSLRDWCHPRDHVKWSDTEFLTDHISEGASAFRKEAFIKAGGYFAPFFIGHEGPDLSFRLIKTGYEVWYSPDVEVLHFASNDARPGSRAYYYNTRNNIWLAYRHFPAGYAIRYVLFYTGMMVLYAIKAGQAGAFMKGVSEGITKLRGLGRLPLTNVQMDRIRMINAHKPSLVSKVLKHLGSRQSYR